MTASESGAEAAPNARRTWAYLVMSALALFYVLLAPFSVFISPEAVVPWYAGVAALTWVGVLLVARRAVFGCLEVFVPMVATVWTIAFTAARPDVIGLWIPLVQGIGMLAIVVLLRVRGPGQRRTVSAG